MNRHSEHTSVLIVGAGPVGLSLANLLGIEGVSCVLIERNDGCIPEPRAVVVDGESMRTFQTMGLVDELAADMRQGFVADYQNAEGVHLFSSDLRPRPYGFCLQNAFDQPTLERSLLAGLDRFDCVTVHHGTELLNFEVGAEGVQARIRTRGEVESIIRADYLVGTDGGRSMVRAQLGIAMQGERLPQKWLVVDTIDHHPGDDPECRFYCDPKRPAMTILRPRGERRWEWMLMPGETDAEMLEDDRIDALLAAHTDPAQVHVYRRCVYGFSAVVAERFAQGPVLLAGDAAHMTPPFAGQGLNAGIRDVRNLAWKLARVLDGRLPEALLATYDQERHDAARAMVDMAVALGNQIQPIDPEAAAARDAHFAALNRDPEAARSFNRESGASLADVRLLKGWFDSGSAGGGRMLHQPSIQTPAGEARLDELLGDGFSVLCCGGAKVPESFAANSLWRALAPHPVSVDPACGLSEADFGGVLDPADTALVLIRPDRFVMAQLRPEDSAIDTLDRLRAVLEG